MPQRRSDLGGSAAALALGFALLLAPPPSPGVPSIDATGPDSAQPADTWRPLPASHLVDGRSHFSVVWTGRELILWGGMGCAKVYCGDGARYNPVTGVWTPMSTIHAPTPRDAHTAVWTGREMLVWGGESGPSALTQGPGGALGDGGAYNPATDTWRSLSNAGAPSPRDDQVAVWTGREMLVLGGSGNWPDIVAPGAGAYTPSTDTWRPLSPLGAPDSYRAFTALWTGHDLLVWGGLASEGGDSSHGFRYDPARDAWTPHSTLGAPSPRYEQVAVWTGRRKLVWGGAHGPPPPYEHSLGDGAAYDPATDSLTALSMAGAPSARSGHSAVWSGQEMLVWGGSGKASDQTGPSSGARYAPSTNAWLPMSSVGAPGCSDEPAVWNGTAMVVLGCVHPFAARYAPSHPAG